jgi:uncharacterized alkaline shock family protein YloU
MNIDKHTPYGDIDITFNAIQTVAGFSASECYGVAGLVCRRPLSPKAPFLEEENLSKAVAVRKTEKGYEVDVSIAIVYGLKVTEIVSEVQKKISFDLKKTFGIKLLAVNVFVETLTRLE